MAATNNEFTTHCVELLMPLGAVRARRKFGGCGLYVDDLFIALIAAERLYLKTDPQTRVRFETAGCSPFTFETKGKTMTTSYFSAPEDAMESPVLMQPWARLALDAALRARAAKPASARASKKATPPAAKAGPRHAARPRRSRRHARPRRRPSGPPAYRGYYGGPLTAPVACLASAPISPQSELKQLNQTLPSIHALFQAKMPCNADGCWFFTMGAAIEPSKTLRTITTRPLSMSCLIRSTRQRYESPLQA